MDAVMYKMLKHMLRMKTTTLTMNVRVVFELPKFDDRKRINTLVFSLKHWFIFPPDNSSTASILQPASSLTNQVILNTIMGD